MRRSFHDIDSPIQGFNQSFDQDFLFQPQSNAFPLQCNPFKKTQPSESHIQSYQANLKNLLQTYGESSQIHQFSHLKPQPQRQSNSTQKLQPGKRPAKVEKAGQYSKNYREKRKQHIKMLEDQNLFLKKKVDDLQNRLKEKVLELNRIKFAVKKEDHDIQKLSQQITTKLSLIADVESVPEMKQQKDTEFIEEDKKMGQFLKFFQTYGLGGQKSKQILEYYVNQFLQNVMRDRQKYYFMKCIKKQGLKQYKTPLDYALKEVMEQTTDQQAKNSIKVYSQLRPLSHAIKDTCHNFYKTYQKLINLLQKTHHILKAEFEQSLELTKKRLRIILWFQQNQYTKEVRNLRAEWIEMIKGENDYDDELTTEKGTKKAHH